MSGERSRRGLIRSGLWFPLLIVGGFLGLSVLANVVLVVRATDDPSFAVEKDYYRKAKAWDEAQARRAAAARLGWDVEVAWSQGARGPELRVSLRDRDGEPIEGARVALEAFHAARAARVARGEGVEVAPGVYAFSPGASRAGLWVVRLAVDHAGAHWEGERRLDLVLQE